MNTSNILQYGSFPTKPQYIIVLSIGTPEVIPRIMELWDTRIVHFRYERPLKDLAVSTFFPITLCKQQHDCHCR